MKVLIVGYGNIGRIKSALWQHLGHEVYVFDSSQMALNLAIAEGLKSSRFISTEDKLIIDICSASSQHFKSLEWALSKFVNTDNLILIEKPLASSNLELKKYKELIQQKPELKKRIFLNESYFSSSAVNFASSLIEHADGKVKIDIEFSKNRLPDNHKGRFFDRNLGALGIELPHTLAVLQALGLDLDLLVEAQGSLYVSNDDISNQGYELLYDSQTIGLRIASFLGDFNISNGKPINNPPVTRLLKIESDNYRAEVMFDPVPDLPRYFSSVAYHQDGRMVDIKKLDDNHLLAHMERVVGGQYSSDKYIAIDNAIRLSEIGIKLSKIAQVKSVSVNNAGGLISNHVG